MWIASIIRDMKDPDHKWDDQQVLTLRATVFGAAAVCAVVVIMILAPMGYFGPLSSRVRGLFVQHTRTGNPLVDSVAEHQPATADAYFRFLHFICYYGPVGFVISCFKKSDSGLFLVFYGITAYYFCTKMSRLIILLGPIASALGGIAVSGMANWCIDQYSDVLYADKAKKKDESTKAPASPTKSKKSLRAKKKREKGLLAQTGLAEVYEESAQIRKGLAVFFVLITYIAARQFWHYSHIMAVNMSHPSIMFKANLRNGETIIVDDYREAYWWLRDNTPEDARVMSWWDYGYQITGIANRTTIADGNTWNHEHIATLGRCLTSPVKRAHKIVRHLADYVLIWTGGGGDDLAKSPHMARIGNSVFHDICPGDPTCRKFGFVNQGGTPTKMMAASLLYKLHSHNQKPGVRANPKLFKEVFTSKYNKVRIFKVRKVSKKSKAWNADPSNRKCDVPGSWYCVGQYPPALHKLIAKRKDFKQLEDFNVERTDEDDEYTREYMRRMAGYGGDDPEEDDDIEGGDTDEIRQRRLARHKARKAAKKKMMTEDVEDEEDDEDNEPIEEQEDEEEEGDEPPLRTRDG